MSNQPTLNELFERKISFPDIDSKDRLERLVGLSDQTNRLSNLLSLMVNPTGLLDWAKKFHPKADEIMKYVQNQPPLVILAGDVGVGKTELAESIGDKVARTENISITLLPLSLSTRGQGRVGEITQLLTAAFDFTFNEAKKIMSGSGRYRGAIILLVDEADALAQSRELLQMHHEDRAGVNAFIRGIDRVTHSHLPVAIIMCTNRLGSLDPAIKRRAAEILIFSRPNDKQRFAVLSPSLVQIGFTNEQIELVVKETGPTDNCSYGFTFSDLTQRFLPSILRDAYPNQSIILDRVVEIAKNIDPTPPFQDFNT